MNPLLLCARMEPGRLLRLSMIAGALGIKVMEVKEDQWSQRLESLCGLKPPAPAVKRAKTGGEMAVMAFFPDHLMDALFEAIRKNGLERPRLMAVLTPTNRAWTMEWLYGELQKEYAAMNTKK